MRNIQHPTSNNQHPIPHGARMPGHWMLVVGCWLFDVIFCSLLLAPFLLRAQAPPQLPPGGLMQLQVAQPAVDVSVPVTATAGFDPAVVRVGEKTFYRVTVDATESSIRWPEEIAAPAELNFGANARGQMTQFLGNKFRPLTAFLYEVRPAAAGHFTVTNFTVNSAGQSVEIPAASLDVVLDNSNSPPARQLVLETSATNIFVGQPFRVRVLLPAAAGKAVEGVRDVQFNGEGFMTDKTAMRMSITSVQLDGQPRSAFIYESVVTPLVAGPLALSAQGFTAPPFSVGPISITSGGGPITLGGAAQITPVFLVSDAVALNVRPVPLEKSPAGYTGTMGKFFFDPPHLSTNRMRVGEPVSLKVVFHGEGDLTRFVPPAAPRSRDWQIIAGPPPATSFTLIPQTDAATNTPAIPFSYFDPATGKYANLTIPPLPVTVVGEDLPVQLAALDDETKSETPPKLSDLAPATGKTVASLKPLQLRGWFVVLQLVPVVGLVILWQWDRRRRFLEAHPEIVRRLQARRALRRVKRQLQNAVTVGDAAAFGQRAVDALCIAVAPHYPANPLALVCGDVLAQLDLADQNSRAGETVRKIFAAADARFALAPQAQADLLALQADVEAVLLKLEARL